MSAFDLTYHPDGDVLRQFMLSPAFVRGLQGPIGSGKSVCCVIDCLRLMLAQERAIDPKTGERTGKPARRRRAACPTPVGTENRRGTDAEPTDAGA